MAERVEREDQGALSISECIATSNLKTTIQLLEGYISERVNFSSIAHKMSCMRDILPKMYNMTEEETKIAFFKRLENSSDPAKYQDFLRVLEEDYPIVAHMIKDGQEITEHMQENEELIRIFIERIAAEINPGEISEALQAREIISMSEGEKARNLSRQHSQKDAALFLLLRMHCRKKTWYKEFLEVLYDTGKHRLVKELDDKIYNKLRKKDNYSAEEAKLSFTAGELQTQSLASSTSTNSSDGASANVHPDAFIHKIKRHKSKEPTDELASINQSATNFEKGATSGVQVGAKVTSQGEPTLRDLMTLVQGMSSQFTQVINRLDSLEKKVDDIQKTLTARQH